MPRPPFKGRRLQKRSPSNSRRSPNPGLDQNNRIKLQQRLANKVVGQRPQDSDDSDRLVTRTRHGRNKRNVEAVYASGGVAKGDTPGVFPTKQERMQRLRSDTNEIIRRSRSKSTDVSNERPSRQRVTEVANNVIEAPSPAATARPIVTKSPQIALPKSQPTPSGETSILGSLKPRRRQASILHLIDNDSSIINPEDEEQFLPDFESTPAPVANRPTAKPGARLSASSLESVSRKRKLGSDVSVADANGTKSTASIQQNGSATRNITPVPLATRRAHLAGDNDDDIMAPPQSSSPESSPQQTKPQPPANKRSKPNPVPTTEQLQALMPSKRRKGNRQRNAPNEFDIPTDSNSISAEASDIEDESIYQPRKRITKPSQTKQKPTTKKGKGTAGSTNPKAPAGASTPAAKAKSKPTKSTSTVPPTPRTPLPLTRNANQANKPLASQNRTRGDKPGKASAVKLSGGSRARRGRSGIAIATGAENDKENSGRGPSLGRRTLRSDDVVVSVEDVDDAMDVDVDVDENEGAELDGDDNVSVAEERAGAGTGTGTSAEVTAWKSKWANIDEWDLEFEDVSASTGGSSPLRVSIV